MHYIKACFILDVKSWVEVTTRRINYVTECMSILVSILVHVLVSFIILFGGVGAGYFEIYPSSKATHTRMESRYWVKPSHLDIHVYRLHVPSG